MREIIDVCIRGSIPGKDSNRDAPLWQDWCIKVVRARTAHTSWSLQGDSDDTECNVLGKSKVCVHGIRTVKTKVQQRKVK